jgi:hypothetical protein
MNVCLFESVTWLSAIASLSSKDGVAGGVGDGIGEGEGGGVTVRGTEGCASATLIITGVATKTIMTRSNHLIR